MIDIQLRRIVASVALCVAMPLSFARTPGTSGPANPKEVGKPGTSANSGAGTSGALNSSDAKGAKVAADGPLDKKRRSDVRQKRATKNPAQKAASAP